MMTPEQLYDIHCETVGGGKMGHVHWDDLPLETRIQWGRFGARMAPAAPAAIDSFLSYQDYCMWHGK